MPDLKNYIEIQCLRSEDVDLGGGITRRRNDLAFHPGDMISITEKIDGSNASIQYEDGLLYPFSRRQLLTLSNTLSGFYDFVQCLNAEEFSDTEPYAVFGEWLCRNKIRYDADKINKWYIYSIFDKESSRWLGRESVIQYAEKHGLSYIHELYYGPFISWEHCRQFLNSPAYGNVQEGIVVRNFTALNDETCRYPHILKIVNDSFAEVMKKRNREPDPEKEAAKENAKRLMEGIVTKNRVEKGIFRLKEDGILGDSFTPEDMGKVAKNLPKNIYQDCLKEEPEIIKKAGEYAGKMCGSITMQLAREILLP